jgi:hypothetical protein
VVASNALHTATSFLKPSTTKMYTDETLSLMQKKNEFEALEDVDRPGYLDANPDVAMTIGAWGRDPHAHRELVAALTKYRQIRRTHDQAIKTAFYTGQIQDPAFGNDLYEQMRVQLDQLERDYPVFKNWMKTTQEETYIQNIKYLFPILEAEEIEKMRMPSQDEIAQFRDPLIAEATKILESYGIPYSSTGPLARRIKHQIVEAPTQQFTGELPSDLSRGEKNNYRILAMGQGPGLFRTTQYIEMVTNSKKRGMWMAGLVTGKADVDNLLFMFKTPEEKEFMGVKPSEEAERIWDQYCELYNESRNYLDAQKINVTSKKGKAFIKEVMAIRVAQWREESPDWAFEYDFSNLTTPQRFEELGYAKGSRPAARSWRYFLDTIDEMWDALDAEELTTTGGQGAADIVHQTRKKLAKVTKDKDFMWEWNLLGLSLSKFGISKWRLPSKPDWLLYANDPESGAPDIYE